MTTLVKFSDMAHDVQGQLDDQLEQLSRWLKPYRKQIDRLSKDLLPYGKQALEMARKHPGKTVAGALVVGFLLARLGRR